VAGNYLVQPPTPSALVRTRAQGALVWVRGRSRLRLGGSAAVKLFFDPAVASQDVLVGELAVDERLRLSRTVELGAASDDYDPTQWNQDSCVPCRRDLRTGSAVANLRLVSEPAQLSLTGGYRGFVYKPDETYDFNAALAGAATVIRLRGRDEDAP